MTTHSYDLAIIGAGPGGYVAAIRAAQLGLDVAVIEQLPTLGGTCLNVGCIPSKALLNASHHFALARDHFADMGIIADPVLDLGRMMQAKQSTVENLTKGIDFLFAKNKITRLTGRAMVQAPGHIQIQDGPDQGKEVHSTSIIIATGSQSASIPGITVDEKHIVSSTGALAFQSVPDHLLVVGAGVIGLELGSVWSRLGSKVTVVEFLPRIVPSLDGEIAKNFQRILTRQGLKFITEHKLDEVEIKDQGLIAHITGVGRRQGKEARIECDRILIATGRRPVSANLGLEALGIQTDDHGFIKTDTNLQTNIASIYAIGDCKIGPMLAHKAEDEGIAAVETIAGLKGHVDFARIPSVIYTEPEVADIGMNEEQLKRDNIDYVVGKFSFTANSRARVNGTTAGFVKILTESGSDRILGAHILGAQAGELIHELVAVIEFGGSAEDVARMCHAHPTLSEAVREAALGVSGRVIHS